MITTDSFNENLDMLKLYFGKEFPITDNITVFQPTMQDIIDYQGGEEAFYFMLYVFVGNTTYYRAALWDNGIDWNDLTDYQLWWTMVRDLSPEKTKILFGDLDFTRFQAYPVNSFHDDLVEEDDSEAFVLYDAVNDIEITETDYFRTRNYLRYMFNIFPKIQTGIKGKKRTKERLVKQDKVKAKHSRENGSSFLFPMISFCLNHAGFKYKRSELGELGIVEFMDSVQRLENYEQCRATLQGMMSGFVDGSKIKPEQYNFMKDLIIKQQDFKKQIEDAFENPTNYNDALKEELKQKEKR